jgi:hypothetical protein
MIRIRQTAEHQRFHFLEVLAFEIFAFLILWRAANSHNSAHDFFRRIAKQSGYE